MSLFLDVFAGKETQRFPLWMMRQAGRYLPEYQALKQQYRFDELLKSPELAYQVSMQPIERYDLDAIILFSDILVILECLGSQVSFDPEKGLSISPQLDLNDLPQQIKDPKTTLNYVFETIRLIKARHPERTLLGFAGMPFTVLCYALEGKGKLSFDPIKSAYYGQKDTLLAVMDILADCTIEYLLAQVEAGVDAVQVFDSWANVLDWEAAESLSVNYVKKIVTGIRAKSQIPILYYGRHASQLWPLLQGTGLNGISIEWQVDMIRMRQSVSQDIVLQGNLDPFLLTQPWEAIADKVYSYLESLKPYKGIVLNLGHGMVPQAKVETVASFVEAVKAFNR